MKKAAKWLIDNSKPAYDKDCGKCAKFVRKAVEFDLGVKLERAVSAKDYGESYEKVGFKKIFSFPEQDKSKYLPQSGDIAIIQYEPHGHICMFCFYLDASTGKPFKGWISDFKQRDMYGGKIREKNPPFAIYRLENNTNRAVNN